MVTNREIKIMFTIIQDCSPYYITFTYEGLSVYTKQLQDIANQSQFKNSYNNCVAAIQEAIPSYDTDELYVNTEENLITRLKCFKVPD